jgi:hypothetical protein
MSLSKFEEGGENYSDNFRKVEMITARIALKCHMIYIGKSQLRIV